MTIPALLSLAWTAWWTLNLLPFWSQALTGIVKYLDEIEAVRREFGL